MNCQDSEFEEVHLSVSAGHSVAICDCVVCSPMRPDDMGWSCQFKMPIDTKSLTLNEFRVGQQLQNEKKNLVMDFKRKAAADPLK